jgi:hypothetical protein
MGSLASRKRTALTLSDSDDEAVLAELGTSASKATSSNAVRVSGSRSSSSLVPSFFVSTRKSTAPKAAKQAQLTIHGGRTARIMQLLNLKLNAKLLCGEISNIEPNVFVQEMEASFDSTFETVALMEEEEAAVQLAAHRSAADKAADAGSQADLDDMEDNDIAEAVAQQPLDMVLLD